MIFLPLMPALGLNLYPLFPGVRGIFSFTILGPQICPAVITPCDTVPSPPSLDQLLLVAPDSCLSHQQDLQSLGRGCLHLSNRARSNFFAGLAKNGFLATRFFLSLLPSLSRGSDRKELGSPVFLRPSSYFKIPMLASSPPFFCLLELSGTSSSLFLLTLISDFPIGFEVQASLL